jgi:cytochrome c oxidase assembly protein subunit 15
LQFVQSASFYTPAFARGFSHLPSGLIMLALVATAIYISRRLEPRRWVRWLTLSILAAVIVQGLMGGFRVTEVSVTLAIIHGCFAHIFFALSALAVVATSRWWISLQKFQAAASASTGSAAAALAVTQPAATVRRGLVVFGGLVLLLIVTQLILGATMRHMSRQDGTGLAIPDLPWAYGRLIPPVSDQGLSQINQFRTWELHRPAITLTHLWLHFSHRVGAIVVSLAVVGLFAWAIRTHERKLVMPAVAMLLLVFTQFTLGVLVVLWDKPADVASAHVAVGALLLLSTAVLTYRAGRIYYTVSGVLQSQPVTIERRADFSSRREPAVVQS